MRFFVQLRYSMKERLFNPDLDPEMGIRNDWGQLFVKVLDEFPIKISPF